jgi:hypothetical protein
MARKCGFQIASGIEELAMTEKKKKPFIKIFISWRFIKSQSRQRGYCHIHL